MWRSDFPDQIRFRWHTWKVDQVFTVDGLTFQIRQISCLGKTPYISIGEVNSVGTDSLIMLTRTQLWQVVNYGLTVLDPKVVNKIRNYRGNR